MQLSGKFALSLIIWAISFEKAWFLVDNRSTWHHLVDASISTMKYLKGPDRGWIGPQMSPCILCRNIGDSSLIFRRDGLVISFPFAHVVQIKSPGLGKSLTSWPAELLMILLIMLNPG